MAMQTQAIFNPQSLVVRISYKCNIGCRFCYNSSLPGQNTTLDETRVLSLLEEAAAVGIKRLGISGGEVFLFPRPLEKMISRAKELGYEAVSMVTNGFWGRSRTSTENVFQMLGRCDFRPPKDMLTVSAGEFHQEWIQPDSICNVIAGHFDAYQVPITVDFEITNGKDHLAEEFVACARKHGIDDGAYKFRVRKLIANLGRGKDLAPGTTSAKPLKSFGKCSAINRFVAQPDGRVVPCCGFNRFNDGIVLGDIGTSSYGEIVEQANRNTINRYLTQLPMHEIHRELAGHFDLPGEFASACELCEALFGKPEHVKHLELAAPRLLDTA